VVAPRSHAEFHADHAVKISVVRRTPDKRKPAPTVISMQ
jgi:hypothetical protein